MTRPANVNFAKAVNFAMRNGFAKFAKWVVNFAMRNFAKVETNEQCIGIAKLNLALRNWHLALRNWHCEIRIANFGIAKFSHCEIGLRTHCEFWQCVAKFGKVVCEIRNVVCEFRNAKFR